MKNRILHFTIFIFIQIASRLSAQTIDIGFISPDTTCVDELITITNVTTGGSTFYWNFCSGNANIDPIGANIGNPGSLLNIPVYPTLAKDGNDCFSFIPNQGGGETVPLTWTI